MSELKCKVYELCDEIVNYLNNEEGYSATRYGVEANLDLWAGNKEALYKMLKNHPLWDEEQLAVVFKEDYIRAVEPQRVREFANWVYSASLDFVPRDDTRYVIPSSIISVRYWRDDLYNALMLLGGCKDVTISDDVYDAFTKYPEIHIAKGLKTTRAFNKLCIALGLDKHPEYNKKYARLADALSPITATRFTALSIHPIDYLRMSKGNSWTSCHRIGYGDAGCYSAGCLSYMNDATTMIFSTYERDEDASSLRYSPKTTRQCFYFYNHTLLQSRLYPQNNDGCVEVYDKSRKLVEDIIATALGESCLWLVKRAKYHEGSGSLNYHDFRYLSSELSKAYILASMGDEADDVAVGTYAYDVATEHQLRNTEDIQQALFCEQCGHYVDHDDAIYIGDYAYCRDCANYCDICDEWTLDEVTYINGFGNVCGGCLEGNFVQCVNCGEYIRCGDEYEAFGDYYCEDCYNELEEDFGDE